jgi:hypothetical protein
MIRTKVLCLIFASFVIVACGYKEGVVQQSEAGYIEFTGNWKGAMVVIDDLEPFTLSYIYDRETGSTSSAPRIYKLSPGKHRVRVYRGDRLMVDRVVFLSSQSRLEVDIP